MSIKEFLLAIFLFVGAFSLPAQTADSIYTNAERMPYFAGCTAYKVNSKERRQCSNQTVKGYIFNHIVYPPDAKEANIEGAVYVRFVVDEMGYVKQPELLKDIGGGCGAAALKVIIGMPKWEPAFHQGNRVKVALELPIHFYFKDNDTLSDNTYSLAWGQLNEMEVSKKRIRKNIDKKVTVLDAIGSQMTISELHFTSRKGNKLTHKASNGRITPAMTKLVKKLRKGNRFSIVAIIQKNSQFVEVAKEYYIIRK